MHLPSLDRVSTKLSTKESTKSKGESWLIEKGGVLMTPAKKQVIIDLVYRMIIEPSQGFPPHEFEESVKLFLDIVQTLLNEDYQKDNI